MNALQSIAETWYLQIGSFKINAFEISADFSFLGI
jgi:hypothetical protein